MSREGKFTYHLPGEILGLCEETLGEWERERKVGRLWSGDSSLWTGRDERDWLGWLGVPGELLHAPDFRTLGDSVKAEGVSHVLLLGMGGSSLSADVLAKVFGKSAGYPELCILDSTVPAQVEAALAGVDLARTLFVVASKSGTTLEPNILMSFFLDRVKKELGAARAGDRFIAITDPGSRLEKFAESEGFRRVFHGVTSVGGRYSALSPFGLVPAALMGLDVGRLQRGAAEMKAACSAGVPVRENPGVVLGVILGICAREGRDKVTLVASPGVAPLGAWLEQLLAESTGKGGKGIIPVDGEPIGPPEVYDNDRVFVYLTSRSSPGPLQDQALWALEKAGHPVVRIEIGDAYDLSREFFRWMFATAVAGAVMGVNPFDQPDVEAAKKAAKALALEYERTGSLPAAPSLLVEGDITLFADPVNAKALERAAGGERSMRSFLKAHFDRLAAGDYFALLAYLEMTPLVTSGLQVIRRVVRDRQGVATCVGFGPRYLHSTGQVHKGGPDTGGFLLVTSDDSRDIPVPGERFTFGVVKAAQAGGDFQVLAERGRRILGVNLGGDTAKGLGRLVHAVLEALGGP